MCVKAWIWWPENVLYYMKLLLIRFNGLQSGWVRNARGLKLRMCPNLKRKGTVLYIRSYFQSIALSVISLCFELVYQVVISWISLDFSTQFFLKHLWFDILLYELQKLRFYRTYFVRISSECSNWSLYSVALNIVPAIEVLAVNVRFWQCLQ